MGTLRHDLFRLQEQNSTLSANRRPNFVVVPLFEVCLQWCFIVKAATSETTAFRRETRLSSFLHSVDSSLIKWALAHIFIMNTSDSFYFGYILHHCSRVSSGASSGSDNLYWRRGGGRPLAQTDLHCGPLDTAATFDFETSFKGYIRSYLTVPWLPICYDVNFSFCNMKTFFFQKWNSVPVDCWAFGGGGRQFALTSQLENIGWDRTVLAFRFLAEINEICFQTN